MNQDGVDVKSQHSRISFDFCGIDLNFTESIANLAVKVDSGEGVGVGMSLQDDRVFAGSLCELESELSSEGLVGGE